jgi:hypothetical protein
MMLVWTVEFSCWLILVQHVLCCWLSWPLNLITQSGRGKLNYITTVAIRNLCVEQYGHCTVKQIYEYVFNNTVKVTNGI